MEIVITIVSDPLSFPLTGEIVAGSVRAIEAEGGKLVSQTLLAKNEAVDLFFTDIDKTVAKSVLAKLFTAMPLDFFCAEHLPDIARKKKMLVADMDSTILTVECIDEIADMLGIKQQVSQITEAAMRGELDFSASLVQRVALLKGLPASKLDEVYKTHIHLSKGAKTLVKTMVGNGASAHLLSGGFKYFSEKVAVEVGFTHNHANVLEIENEVLTGKVTPPILHADSKRELLIEARAKYKLDKNDVLAVGDGANDIPMILEAGLGVAYMAKPKTVEQATAAINHTSLETLLFYQGYKKAEFTN